MLVISELVGMRENDGWFRSPDVGVMFDELRIPRPGNLNATLTNLKSAGLLISRSAGTGSRWSLTPLGHKRAAEVVGEIDPASIAPQLAAMPGAELGHARHATLPPTFAPARWSRGIAQLLDRFPFEANVFCMTRFPDQKRADDPVGRVITTAAEALELHGLKLHLASDRIVEEDIFGNVAAYMWACQYGIGLFEDRVERSLNYNLVTEIGSMIMAGRRCALLKDRTAPEMPTDLVGQIYKPVDFDDLDGVSREVHAWAAEDLNLGRCRSCPA